ncbi:unnamed protein product [Zymoseptoria tritici ST99CH_3D7]|uniref:Uncharacterized protein n=2 Tax=Zymoseptoria tritici TaxID=1047171 RepID=A0A1X7S9F1_ZYMT9|nr:unnamed protein product [Zymoseptoria tritici ST99CH_3D7]
MTDPNPNNGSSSNNSMQGNDRRLPPLAPNTSSGTLPTGFGGGWLARGGAEPGSGLQALFNEWFLKEGVEDWRKKQYKGKEPKK